jgi:hypothetical protein
MLHAGTTSSVHRALRVQPAIVGAERLEHEMPRYHGRVLVRHHRRVCASEAADLQPTLGFDETFVLARTGLRTAAEKYRG